MTFLWIYLGGAAVMTYLTGQMLSNPNLQGGQGVGKAMINVVLWPLILFRAFWR